MKVHLVTNVKYNVYFTVEAKEITQNLNPQKAEMTFIVAE